MTPLTVTTAAFAGAELYMALMFFFLPAPGPAQRHYRVFALACLALTGYTAMSAVLYSSDTFEVARWVQRVQVGFAFLGLPLMIRFARDFTHRHSRTARWGEGVLWGVLGVYVAGMATDLVFTSIPSTKELVLFGHIQVVHEAMPGPIGQVLGVVALLALGWLVTMLIDPVRKGVASAIPFLIGSVCVLAGTINDIAVVQGWLQNIYLAEYGFLTLAVCGAVSLTLGTRQRERELARTHEELQQLRGMEEQLARSERLATLGRMLSGVAHELNNPLTSVIGIAESVRADEFPPGLRTRIGLMRREAMRAGQLVRGLLETTQTDTPEMQPVDLAEVIEQVAMLRRDEQERLGIELDVEHCGGAPHVKGNADQLLQLILNLVTNAEYALGGVRDPSMDLPGGHIRVATACDDEQVVLTVQDDGPGIPPEILPAVFDPFVTTRRRKKGTGIGLFMAASIAERHRGLLSARNNDARGACFTLRLPLTHEQPHSGEDSIPIDVASILAQAQGSGGLIASLLMQQVSPEIGEAPGKPLDGVRVAVIDDEEGVALSVRYTLEGAGAQVGVALDGGAAVELLVKQPWDVVLCDVLMPDMDGLDLLEWAADGAPDLAPRFVFMTGDIFATRVRAVAQERLLGVLQKPFRSKELIGAVHETLLQHGSFPLPGPDSLQQLLG